MSAVSTRPSLAERFAEFIVWMLGLALLGMSAACTVGAIKCELQKQYLMANLHVGDIRHISASAVAVEDVMDVRTTTGDCLNSPPPTVITILAKHEHPDTLDIRLSRTGCEMQGRVGADDLAELMLQRVPDSRKPSSAPQSSSTHHSAN